ncbi:MAG: hypothetical protein ABIK76_05935 [candidate division WOR-3 bacterium]
MKKDKIDILKILVFVQPKEFCYRCVDLMKMLVGAGFSLRDITHPEGCGYHFT